MEPCLIKLHKDGFPLRDISDASQSPGHKLAKAILPLFSGYTGQSEHHLSSHSQLIDILRSGRFNGGFFVSHDAVELYPSIIIADALQLLEEKMANDTKWAWKTDLSRNEILGLVNCSFVIHISNVRFFPTSQRHTYGWPCKSPPC